jgi:hypothetical protein
VCGERGQAQGECAGTTRSDPGLRRLCVWWQQRNGLVMSPAVSRNTAGLESDGP